MLGSEPYKYFKNMNWIIKKLVKLFFNNLYKVRPPESVNYYKTQEFARARLVNAKDGSLQMEIKHDSLPVEKMPPAVRHIWETLEKLEEMEVVEDMKARIRLIRKVLCFFLESDDAYRFRAQMFLDLIDQKKIALSKSDLYFARGKYWKADRYKKVLGKWM